MFLPQQIDTIFGNLEELLEFQSTFLQDLENHVEWDAPHRSCIGECFLAHVSKYLGQVSDFSYLLYCHA